MRLAVGLADALHRDMRQEGLQPFWIGDRRLGHGGGDDAERKEEHEYPCSEEHHVDRL